MADSLNLNVTALNTDTFHGWMSPPNTRGTSQILYSCLLTISACIYTSIHLNIPDPYEKQRWQFIRKIKWAIIGIFAPEMVLYVAWTQHREASHFITELCEVAPDYFYMESSWTRRFWMKVTSWSRRPFVRKSPSQPSEGNQAALEETNRMLELPVQEKDVRVRIDLSYGFYAIMGGIRVDTSDLEDQGTSMALTNSKLLEILDSAGEPRHEFLKGLRIDLKAIKDRSKANSITKILICFQVLGTAIQCIARKAHGLPLTLLEYHTFAHVVCAIGIYAVWFQKPLDVNEATIVHLPDQLKAGLAEALMLYRPKCWYYEMPHTCEAANTLIAVPEQGIEEFNALEPWQSENPSALEAHTTLKSCNLVNKDKSKSYSGLTTPVWKQQVTHAGQNKLLILLSPLDGNHARCSCAGLSTRHLVEMDFTEKDRNRWNALTSDKVLNWRQARLKNRGGLYQSRRPNSFVLLKQWSFFDDKGDFFLSYVDIFDEHKVLGIATAVAICITGLYGGVHAFAWHAHFSSAFEKWGWRCSSLISIAFLPVMAVLIWTTVIFGEALDDLKGRLRSRVMWVHDILYLVRGTILIPTFAVSLAILFANPLARIFLVVETFASLRSVPIGVYDTVSWTQYVPHL